MPKGEPISRLDLRFQIEMGAIPLSYIHPLGQAILGLVVEPSCPTYKEISDSLAVPGLDRIAIANYVRIVRMRAQGNGLLPTNEGKSLADANERYVAQRILRSISPASMRGETNNKSVLLSHVARLDTENHSQAADPSRQDIVTDGSRGYKDKTAEQMGFHRQELTQLRALMMHDIEQLILDEQLSSVARAIEELPLCTDRRNKSKPFVQGMREDLQSQMFVLIGKREKLEKKRGKDRLDVALLEALQAETSRLSKIATRLMNVPIVENTLPGYVLLYLDALKKVAERKIGKRVGKSEEDSVRLTHIAVDIGNLYSANDLRLFLQSCTLPDAWKNEVYTELLPFFCEVYQLTNLYFPTDRDLLERLASKQRQSITQLRDEGIGRLKGGVIGTYKHALLYGSPRQSKYWPQTARDSQSE